MWYFSFACTKEKYRKRKVHHESRLLSGRSGARSRLANPRAGQRAFPALRRAFVDARPLWPVGKTAGPSVVPFLWILFGACPDVSHRGANNEKDNDRSMS
jgi:hypothetical protein